MPDQHFADPRLARLYDALDADRSDLDHYVALVNELGGDRVLDLGCGTGVLALMLADQGRTVIGVDPAGASLDVARAKPGSGRVAWVEADATQLPVTEDIQSRLGDVSMHTVRKHLKNADRKLGVTNRTAATALQLRAEY